MNLRTKPRDRHYDEWFTPPHIIEALGPFDLDPACSPLCPNKTARRRFGKKENGLKQPWRGRVWLNPPFSNMTPWVDRMIAHNCGTLLLFAGSESRWQYNLLAAAKHVFFLPRNPKFGRPRPGLPDKIHQRVWLIPFGDRDVEAIKKSGLPGLLMKLESAA